MAFAGVIAPAAGEIGTFGYVKSPLTCVSTYVNGLFT